MSDEIKCPKCKSTQIHADKKGFSTGKAIAGTLIAGPLVGAAAGAVGANRIKLTCLKCGNTFNIGEGVDESTPTSSYKLPEGVKYVKEEFKHYKCPSCDKISSLTSNNNRCPKCGKALSSVDLFNASSEPVSKSGCLGSVIFISIIIASTIIIFAF